ncbi:MAG: hypothetical protein JXB15_11805 [Anaerolineales bacterium]|nr:hypothetical protein [Anaerolineales bacterium]
MDSQMVAVLCLCDDILKALYHRVDRQCWITDAEIMTIALAATLYFSGVQACYSARNPHSPKKASLSIAVQEREFTARRSSSGRAVVSALPLLGDFAR